MPRAGVVDDQPVVGRQRDRAIDGLEALLEQRVVVVDASPALPVVAVGDVELRARVAAGGVGAREGGARFDERVAPEEGEPIGGRLLVDL